MVHIRAPIAGVVVQVSTTAGTSVTHGEPLFAIVNPEELWIRAHVPEQQAAGLRGDRDASFRPSGTQAWLPLRVTGEDPPAEVVNIGPTVEKPSRTVAVVYALAQPDTKLRVGSSLQVAVPRGEVWHGVVLPRSAVLADEGIFVVYVQVEGEAFEERIVRLGPQAGGQVAIEHGVEADERVVTRGANLIRLAARASTAPAHGHVH